MTIQVQVDLAVTVVCQGSLASLGSQDSVALVETQGSVGSRGRVGFLGLQASPVIRVTRPVIRAFQGGAGTIQVQVVIRVTAEFQDSVV